MNIALWIVAALLALAAIGAGARKLTTPKEKLAASGMTWVEDFSPSAIRTIAGLEVLGGLGVVLPPLVGVAEILSPVAATGLFVLFVGAVVVHLRRGETKESAPAVVIGLLALVVAVGRFVVSPF